jgi:hypothetical protein
MYTTSSCSSCAMQTRLHLIIHRVPWTKPTCLSITWRPLWLRPFALVLHLQQCKLSRIQHLQY